MKMITAHRSGTTIAICGLLAISFVHGTPVGDCHCRNPLKQAYHLADDKDCTVFYKCVNTSPVKFACPEGLHFNRRLEVCDWPANAGCSDSENNASSEDVARRCPEEPRQLKQPHQLCPLPVTCPTYGNGKPIAINVPHAYNCSKFCKCSHGQPVAIDCPSGLHFNPALEVCDWPETAGCYVSTVWTKTNPSTRSPSTSQTGYSATSECDTTTDTSTSDLSTPEKLSTTLSDTEIISGDCPAIGTCPQHEDDKSIVKQLPHAYNCSQFCKCQQGVPIKFDCPVGLHFNPVLEDCDWPQNSNCSSSFSARLSTIPSTVYTTLEADPTFTDATNTSTQPLTDVPTSTSELSTGHTYESDTASDAISTTDTTTTELTTDAITTTVKPPTNFPTHTTEQFTRETDLTTTTTDETTATPESIVRLETSTFSSTTPCASEKTSVTTTAGAEGTAVLPEDEDACAIIQSCPKYNQQSIVKHFPHPTNRNFYCRCNHGAAITQRCPAGLHFNAKLEVCDWPSNANCR